MRPGRRSRLHPVPALAILFYLVMAVALTWPGYLPFNRIRPFVLGLPFSIFWQVFWIVAAVAVMTAVFVWDRRRSTGTD